MQNIKMFLHDDKFATIASSEVVYASHEQEFFYEGTDEPVPYGEPIGIDVPHFNLNHLHHEPDETDDIRALSKLSHYRNEEYEALINDWMSPKEVELVLFKNIYWAPDYPEAPLEDDPDDII